MTTSFKKLLLISITLLLGVMSGGVMAQSPPAGDIVYNFSENFTTGDAQGVYAGTVWTDSSGKVNYFSNLTFNGTTEVWDGLNAYGSNKGQINSLTDYHFTFTYNSGYDVVHLTPAGSWKAEPGLLLSNDSSPPASQLTAGAPEIDGSLAPKVGFLLGCLFLMFGRKKQNSEPMMTA